MATIDERVKMIIVHRMAVKPTEVLANATFIEDFHADQLKVVELAMDLEEEFSISISDEESEQMSTVQAAIDLVKQKVG